jgi:hypothetical protein
MLRLWAALGAASLLSVALSSGCLAAPSPKKTAVLLLTLTCLAAFLAVFIPNRVCQGRLWDGGGAAHQVGGVCDLGVMSGFLLCGLCLGQLGFLFAAPHRFRLLRRGRWVLALLLLLLALGSFLLNSSWNYTLRGLGFRPGFFEYLVPALVFQGAYLCLLFS